MGKGQINAWSVGASSFLGFLMVLCVGVGASNEGHALSAYVPHPQQQHIHNPYNPNRQPYHYGYCQIMLQQGSTIQKGASSRTPSGEMTRIDALEMAKAANTILHATWPIDSCWCEQVAGAYAFLQHAWDSGQIPSGSEGDQLRSLVAGPLYTVTNQCTCAADYTTADITCK